MTITVQVPDSLLEGLAESPEELGREIRLAAAIHLYSRGLISQGRGAEIAGLNRWEFIQALGRAEVPACQVTSLGATPREATALANRAPSMWIFRPNDFALAQMALISSGEYTVPSSVDCVRLTARGLG